MAAVDELIAKLDDMISLKGRRTIAGRIRARLEQDSVVEVLREGDLLLVGSKDWIERIERALQPK